MDKAKKRIRRVLLYLLIVAVCLVTNLPMLSMLGTAFKPANEVMANTNLFTAKKGFFDMRSTPWRIWLFRERRGAVWLRPPLATPVPDAACGAA